MLLESLGEFSASGIDRRRRTPLAFRATVMGHYLSGIGIS
jgi:hypothetical protein